MRPKRRERYHVYLSRVNYKPELLPPARFLEGAGAPVWERVVLADSYTNALAQVIDEARVEFPKLRGLTAAFYVGVKGSVSKKAERLDPIRVNISTGLPMGRWNTGFTSWEEWKHPRKPKGTIGGGQFMRTGVNKTLVVVRSIVQNPQFEKDHPRKPDGTFDTKMEKVFEDNKVLADELSKLGFTPASNYGSLPNGFVDMKIPSKSFSAEEEHHILVHGGIDWKDNIDYYVAYTISTVLGERKEFFTRGSKHFKSTKGALKYAKQLLGAK